MPDNNVIAVIIYIVPAVTMIISILTFSNAVKERHGRSAAEAVEIKKDLEKLTEKVQSLEEQICEAINGYHENDKRITTLETKMRAIEARVKTLEGHHTTR